MSVWPAPYPRHTPPVRTLLAAALALLLPGIPPAAAVETPDGPPTA